MEGVVFMLTKEQREKLKPAFALYEKIGAAIGSSKGQDVLNAFALLMAANCSARDYEISEIIDYLEDATEEAFRAIVISGEIKETNVGDINDFVAPFNKKEGH